VGIAIEPTHGNAVKNNLFERNLMNKSKHFTDAWCLAMVFTLALAASVSAQTPIVLFQDGFENSVAGTTPAPTDPAVGSYVLTGTVSSSNLRVLTGPSVGGPTGAAEGTNYMVYNVSGGTPLFHAVFATPLYATNAPFHVSFYKWRPVATGTPQMILGSGTAVNGLTQLAYTADFPNTLAWDWYNGSVYTLSGLVFTTNNWDFVEMDFDGTNLVGQINGGPAASLGQFGGSDKLMDRILFRSGGSGTIFYLDDIKVTTTAPILLRSLQPAPGATGATRLPVIQVQLADGTRSVQTGTIQLYFNDVQVTPVVTQSIVSGANVTTITYQPPASLAYGSTNTVKCIYGDDATPTDLFTREWSFTVYTGDTIFADNYEASVQLPVPFNDGAAYEGTNCLALNRIGAGLPDITGAGDTNLPSVVGDFVTLNCAVRVDSGVLAIFLGNRSNITTAGQYAKFNLFSDGRISIVDATGGVNQFLAQTLASNTWNTVEIQYTNGSATWSVSVNGAPFESQISAVANVNAIRLNAAAAATASWTDDLVLSNRTANTLLFEDGFENAAVGLPPVANTPTVGTYSTITPGTVAGGLFVTTGLSGTNFMDQPPNAPQVGTYDDTTTVIAATGTGHGGTKYVDLYQGSMKMAFITPIPAGTKLHAETWIKWLAGNVGWELDAEGDDQFARITANDAFGITLFDGSTEVDTGFGHTQSAWEKYALDYVVGDSKITFTFNSIYSVDIPVTPRFSIKGLKFFEADASSRANVDDVIATANLGDIPATSPRLDIVRSGNQLMLSWTNAAGYVLQGNSNLNPANGWTTLKGGGISPVQVPADAPAVFYRLAKPN